MEVNTINNNNKGGVEKQILTFFGVLILIVSCSALKFYNW
jgi:hypothetical protein